MDEDEDEQLKLPLEEAKDDRLYVESLTATADSVLYNALGKYDRVFLIGVNNDDGFDYMASDGHLLFWSAVLQKANEYIMRRMF
jgi:hypothetical protein